MLLSDLLASFDDDGIAAETAFRLGDLASLNTILRLADAGGISLGEYARSAVRRFADGAGDEEWLSLLGAMGRSADPGAVCLQRALAYVTRQDSETH